MIFVFYIDRSSMGSSPLGSNARTIATTSLTAAQLQQLAASRGSQVLSALQSQLKSGNLAYSYTILIFSISFLGNDLKVFKEDVPIMFKVNFC